MRMSDFFNFVGTNQYQTEVGSDNTQIVQLADGSAWRYLREANVYEQIVTGARISPLQLDNLRIGFNAEGDTDTSRSGSSETSGASSYSDGGDFNIVTLSRPEPDFYVQGGYNTDLTIGITLGNFTTESQDLLPRGVNLNWAWMDRGSQGVGIRATADSPNLYLNDSESATRIGAAQGGTSEHADSLVLLEFNQVYNQTENHPESFYHGIGTSGGLNSQLQGIPDPRFPLVNGSTGYAHNYAKAAAFDTTKPDSTFPGWGATGSFAGTFGLGARHMHIIKEASALVLPAGSFVQGPGGVTFAGLYPDAYAVVKLGGTAPEGASGTSGTQTAATGPAGGWTFEGIGAWAQTGTAAGIAGKGASGGNNDGIYFWHYKPCIADNGGVQSMGITGATYDFLSYLGTAGSTNDGTSVQIEIFLNKDGYDSKSGYDGSLSFTHPDGTSRGVTVGWAPWRGQGIVGGGITQGPRNTNVRSSDGNVRGPDYTEG